MGDRWATRGSGRGWFRPGRGQRAIGQSPRPVPAGGPEFLSDGIRLSPADGPERVRVPLRVPVRYRIIPERIWGGAGIRVRIPGHERVGIPVADYACISEPIPIPVPISIALHISISVGVAEFVRLRLGLGFRVRIRVYGRIRCCVPVRIRVPVGAAGEKRPHHAQGATARFDLDANRSNDVMAPA